MVSNDSDRGELKCLRLEAISIFLFFLLVLLFFPFSLPGVAQLWGELGIAIGDPIRVRARNRVDQTQTYRRNFSGI